MAQKITVAELLVDLGVGKNDAAKAAGKLDTRLGKAKKSAKLLGEGLKQLAKGFAVFAAAAAAAALGVFRFVSNVATAGDEIAKTAVKIGAGVEELQRLRFAADRSGASSKNLGLAIKNSAKQLEDAANGGAKLFRDALTELGLSLEDVQGLTAEERIGLFADALNEVADVGQRTAIAMNLFGARAGPELLPLLKEGSAGIKELGDEAERLGLIMSEEDAKASEVFVDRLTDLKAVLTGVKNTIGVELIPIVQDLIVGFTKWVMTNKDLLRQRVAEFFTRVIEVAKKLLPVFEALGKTFVFVVENLDLLIGLMVGAKLASGFAAAATGFTAMGFAASAALGPIGLIFGALAAGIPVALRAGDALGDFLAKDETIRRQKKRGAVPPASGKASAARVKIVKANAIVRREDAILRRHFDADTEDSFGAKQALKRRNKAAAEQEAAERDLVKEQKIEAKETKAFEAERALPTPALGPALPPGFVEPGERKPKRGKRTAKEKDEPSPVSIHSVSDLLTAASGGDLAGLAAATPSAAEIEPTVAVSIINNILNFTNKQEIEGGPTPMETAKLSAKKINEVLDGRVAKAAQSLQGNVVI